MYSFSACTRTYSRITSCPYVEERVGYPMGINNWRYRVMDVLVGIQGERQQRDKLIDAIEGFACVVHDMRVSVKVLYIVHALVY